MFPSFFYGQSPKIKYKLFSYYIRLCREEGILPRMDALSQLVSQYSFGAIVMLVVTLAVAFKFLSELLEYFYNKLRVLAKKLAINRMILKHSKSTKNLLLKDYRRTPAVISLTSITIFAMKSRLLMTLT